MSSESTDKCSQPWTHASLLPDGKVRVCCYNDLSRYFGDRPAEKFATKPAPATSLMDSNLHLQLRREFLNGAKPAACQYCFKKESSQKASRRQLESEPQFDYQKTARLEHLDLRLSSLCNLYCIMCSSDYSTSWSGRLSSQWTQADKKTFSHQESQAHLDGLLQSPENLTSLKSIQLAGGEPFLYKPYVSFLKELNQVHPLKNLKIKINTNGTYIDQEWLETLKSFGAIQILLSLDGPAEINDLYRAPSQIEKILANYELMQLAWPQARFSSVTSVQAFSLFDLPETLMFLKNSFSNLLYMGLNPVLFPKHLNISHLPEDLKQLGLQKLDTVADLPFIEKIDTHSLSFIRQILLQPSTQNDFMLELYRFSQEYFKMDSEKFKKLANHPVIRTFQKESSYEKNLQY